MDLFCASSIRNDTLLKLWIVTFLISMVVVVVVVVVDVVDVDVVNVLRHRGSNSA